jgi:DHA3 family tetracycline resistance protein-like MFS transporter
MKKLDAYKTYLFLATSAALIFEVIFTINMIYQVTVAHLNPLQLVLVGTMLETTIFLFEVPTGVVADVFSRRLSIIIGYVIIGLGFLLEGSIPVFWAILLGQVLWGLGYTFTSGATEAWISDEIGEQSSGKAFLRGAQAGQVGALIGIGISVWLGSIRVNIPIQVGGILFILLAVFLILFMPEHGFQRAAGERQDSFKNMVSTFRSGLNMVRLRPILATILLIGLFYGLYSEGYDRLWTKHLLDRFTLSGMAGLSTVAWFGIINVVGILLSTAATEYVSRKLDTTRTVAITRALLAVTAVLMLALLGYAWVGNLAAALGMIWLIRVARNVIGPIYTTWVNQRLDSRVRATVISMSSQVDAIGQIAGGPVVGVVGNLVSVRAAITASALILSPLLALYTRTLRKEPDESLTAAPIEQGD